MTSALWKGLIGYRKLLIAIAALIILAFKNKIGLDDTTTKWLAGAVGAGFMVGNGLEHIGAGMAANSSAPVILPTTVRGDV